LQRALLAVLNDERDAIIVRSVGGPHYNPLVVDPSRGTVPSTKRAQVLQHAVAPDKRVINKVNVPPNIEDKLARVKVAGYLPQVIERVRKPAAAVAQREVLPNSVAPEPELCVAANIDRSDDLAFLIDATGFGDRGAVAFR